MLCDVLYGVNPALHTYIHPSVEYCSSHNYASVELFQIVNQSLSIFCLFCFVSSSKLLPNFPI